MDPDVYAKRKDPVKIQREVCRMEARERPQTQPGLVESAYLIAYP